MVPLLHNQSQLDYAMVFGQFVVHPWPERKKKSIPNMMKEQQKQKMALVQTMLISLHNAHHKKNPPN